MEGREMSDIPDRVRKSHAEAPQHIKDAAELLVKKYGANHDLLAAAIVGAMVSAIDAATEMQKEAILEIVDRYATSGPDGGLVAKNIAYDIRAAIPDWIRGAKA
jgi:hypothetical protein